LLSRQTVPNKKQFTPVFPATNLLIHEAAHVFTTKGSHAANITGNTLFTVFGNGFDLLVKQSLHGHSR
jgi:hypothetical protein